MAFIATRKQPDELDETLGVARAVADPDNIEAEFAVIVRSDLKGLGLGHLLMHALIAYCRHCGTQRLVGIALRHNHGVLELAQHLGFRLEADADPTTVRFTSIWRIR